MVEEIEPAVMAALQAHTPGKVSRSAVLRHLLARGIADWQIEARREAGAAQAPDPEATPEQDTSQAAESPWNDGP